MRWEAMMTKLRAGTIQQWFADFVEALEDAHHDRRQQGRRPQAGLRPHGSTALFGRSRASAIGTDLNRRTHPCFTSPRLRGESDSSAGVDIDAGNQPDRPDQADGPCHGAAELERRNRRLWRAVRPEAAGFKDPVLVAATDGARHQGQNRHRDRHAWRHWHRPCRPWPVKRPNVVRSAEPLFSSTILHAASSIRKPPRPSSPVSPGAAKVRLSADRR